MLKSVTETKFRCGYSDFCIDNFVAVFLEIRQIRFKVHEEARNTENEIVKTILRTVRQTVAVGDMKEHAMMCSDYVIKIVYRGCSY